MIRALLRWCFALLVLCGHPARAAPRAYLQATVRADLQSVTGQIRLVEPEGIRLEDVLSRLPMPAADLEQRRTFPGVAEQGWVHVQPQADGSEVFYTILPRRYGACGRVPGVGLFANGLWYPQPIQGSAIPVIDWEVVVRLPPDTVGVLNGVVGADVVTWSGQADRLSLAVVPRAHVDVLALPAGEVVVVERGRHQRRREDRLARLVQESWPGPSVPRLVVVETPLRRRLVRTGPGVLYLSDRAMRLTDGLWRYHAPAVRRGILEAGFSIADPWLRSIAAAAFVDEAASRDPDPRDLLGWFSWIPQVDSLLYDGQMPFFADTFDEVWPDDPVRDDLAEVVDPRTPGRPVARKLDTRYGEGTAERFAWLLLQDATAQDAAAALGIAWADLAAWCRPPEPSDLSVQIDDTEQGWRVRLARQAHADTPPELVEFSLDGERRTWETGAGPDSQDIYLSRRPRSVRLDSDGEVLQSERANDTWPQHWTAVASFFPYELTLRTGRISAEADLALRPRYGTRWLTVAGVSTSPENVVAGSLVVYRYLGPLTSRRSRPFRIYAGAGPALLDPDYRPTDEGALAVGTYAGAIWETRVDPDFPRRGHRLWVGGSAGWVPGGDRWGKVVGGGTLLVPLAGRFVLASRLKGGLAEGGVEHRLLALGGGDDIQGLPADAVVGRRKVVGTSELRWQMLRHASLPLPLVWLSDVQLSGGVEAGSVGDGGESGAAVGWTAGLAFTGDVFGARPTMLGVWAAHPWWTVPAGLAPDPWPELYVRMLQPF